MHFQTLLAGLAAFSTAVTAIPAENPHVGVAILTVNEPEGGTLPLNFVNVYSTVKGVKPPEMNQIRCQMYSDQYGTEAITKDLTEENGVVSKKPIYLGWVLCRVKAQK